MYKLVPNFQSVDETLACDHLNKTWAIEEFFHEILSCRTGEEEDLVRSKPERFAIAAVLFLKQGKRKLNYSWFPFFLWE